VTIEHECPGLPSCGIEQFVSSASNPTILIDLEPPELGKRAPNAEHVNQFQFYLNALGIEKGRIDYIDKSVLMKGKGNTIDTSFHVKRDPGTFARAEKENVESVVNPLKYRTDVKAQGKVSVDYLGEHYILQPWKILRFLMNDRNLLLGLGEETDCARKWEKTKQ
jgi:hypothetical protein